jgi:dTDP-4-amino-4,6-dideoxygalactose transaminase
MTVKLKKLDEWNGRRRAVAARYLSELLGLPGLKLPYRSRMGGSRSGIFLRCAIRVVMISKIL